MPRAATAPSSTFVGQPWLKSRRFIVIDVAIRVRYRNFAALSHAFRARCSTRRSDARPSSR
jgi:hypothetical protein